jgi:three-Cys-motif partner protein
MQQETEVAGVGAAVVDSQLAESSDEELHYLKHVSRIKLKILRGYFGAWSAILGKAFGELAYYDCFAGEGLFKDEVGQQIEGSPSQALQIASEWVRKYPGRSVHLGFIEKEYAATLKRRLERSQVPTPGVTWEVISADTLQMSERIVRQLQRRNRVIPTFFFVDPYGYPLPIPLLREMLALPKAEVFVNLMWFHIRMRLKNSTQQHLIDRMFGHQLWREQDFMRMSGMKQEEAFMIYFQKEVGATFHLPFPMTFSPEDNISAPEKRHKYYLIHFASHVRAPLAMKEVMFKGEDSLRELRPPIPQIDLFKPNEAADRLKTLKSILLARFPRGTIAKLIEIRERTWEARPAAASFPFVRSEYRRVLRQMQKEDGSVKIYPSKSYDADAVHFL